MNLLLDTHAIIWFITEDKLLPQKLKESIQDSRNICFVSMLLCGKWGLNTHWENWN